MLFRSSSALANAARPAASPSTSRPTCPTALPADGSPTVPGEPTGLPGRRRRPPAAQMHTKQRPRPDAMPVPGSSCPIPAPKGTTRQPPTWHDSATCRLQSSDIPAVRHSHTAMRPFGQSGSVLGVIRARYRARMRSAAGMRPWTGAPASSPWTPPMSKTIVRPGLRDPAQSWPLLHWARGPGQSGLPTLPCCPPPHEN